MKMFFKCLMAAFLFAFSQISYGIGLSQVANDLAYTVIGADVKWFQFEGKAYIITIGDNSTGGNTGSLRLYEFDPDSFSLSLVTTFDLTTAMFPGDQYYSNGVDVIQFASESFIRIIACGGAIIGGDAYRQFLSFDGSTISVLSPVDRDTAFGKRTSIAFLSRLGDTQLAVATAAVGATNNVVIDIVAGTPAFVDSAGLEAHTAPSSQFRDEADVRWIVAPDGREFLAVGTGDFNSSSFSNPILRIYELTGSSLVLRATVTGAGKVVRSVRWLEKDGSLYLALGYLSVVSPETSVYRVDLPTSTTVSLVPLRTTTRHVETAEWVFADGQHYLLEHSGTTGFSVTDLQAFLFTGFNIIGPVATTPFGTFAANISNRGSRSMYAITLDGVGYIAAVIQQSTPDAIPKLRVFRLGPQLISPVANDDDYELCTDVTNIFLNVLANDIPGSDPALSIVSATTPANGSAVILASLGIIYDTPGGGFTGADSFDYTIEDGNGLQDTATVSITVDNNAGPNAIDDSFTICVGNQVNHLHVLGNDLPGCDKTLQITSFTQGTKGTVTQVSPKVLNYASNGTKGSDSFTYTVEDGNGNTDTATVSITVV